MNRTNSIVKCIKNIHYICIYYNLAIKKQKIDNYILKSIDSTIQNKLNSIDVIKGVYEGLINFINHLSRSLATEYNHSEVDRFKFVCCAYIDDILYNKLADQIWSSYLMEQYFFKTKIAGEKVIHLMNQYIDNHVQQEHII